MGAIGQLEACLQCNQYEFIQTGTYLLLEGLKQGALRRLFKRVALLHREAEPAKASQIPLGALLFNHLVVEENTL